MRKHQLTITLLSGGNLTQQTIDVSRKFPGNDAGQLNNSSTN